MGLPTRSARLPPANFSRAPFFSLPLPAVFSSLSLWGCTECMWQVRKIYPRAGTIGDDVGGYRGSGIYVLNST
eukprot:6079631-Pyramimonas_sp.AAC.1